MEGRDQLLPKCSWCGVFEQSPNELLNHSNIVHEGLGFAYGSSIAEQVSSPNSDYLPQAIMDVFMGYEGTVISSASRTVPHDNVSLTSVHGAGIDGRFADTATPAESFDVGRDWQTLAADGLLLATSPHYSPATSCLVGSAAAIDVSSTIPVFSHLSSAAARQFCLPQYAMPSIHLCGQLPDTLRPDFDSQHGLTKSLAYGSDTPAVSPSFVVAPCSFVAHRADLQVHQSPVPGYLDSEGHDAQPRNTFWSSIQYHGLTRPRASQEQQTSNNMYELERPAIERCRDVLYGR